MAVLQICGFETGNGTESQGSGGTFAVGATARTGAYGLRCNPAASASGYNLIGGYTSTGGKVGLARSAQTWFTFYVKFASLPSGTVRFAWVGGAPTEGVRLNCDSSGNVTITGTTTSATVATISAGTWYRVDLRVTTSGTCGVAIDGGAEKTV